MSEAGVPALRFSEFEGTWDEIRLGSRFPQIRNGFVGTATPYYEAGGIPYLQGKNIKSGLIDPTGLVEISKGFHERQRKSQLKSGDILMVQSGHVGECAVVQQDFDGANCHALIVLTPCAGEDSRWYKSYFYASSGRRKIQKFKTGNTIEHILTSDLKPMRLVVPSPNEQKKIADFLGAVDARLGLLRRRRDALRAYKMGMMKRLFSQDLRFTKADGSPFPDWQEKRLGEVFDRVTRKNAENNQNVMTISAQQGLINQQEFFNKSVSANDVSGYYLLHRNDFAYNKSYSKGYPMGAIKRLRRYDKGVVSTLYICFAAKSSKCIGFFEQFFDNGGLNPELHKIAQEGARNHGLLNMSVVEFFRDIRVPYPHPEEQQKIADTLTALDTKIDAVTAQMSAMLRFKKGLLQQMFV